jgi:hypothetical protein
MKQTKQPEEERPKHTLTKRGTIRNEKTEKLKDK